jgi:hypothetical protein
MLVHRLLAPETALAEGPVIEIVRNPRLRPPHRGRRAGARLRRLTFTMSADIEGPAGNTSGGAFVIEIAFKRAASGGKNSNSATFGNARVAYSVGANLGMWGYDDKSYGRCLRDLGRQYSDRRISPQPAEQR